MKLGQLIECNMRNIFLKKWYIKCGEVTSTRNFIFYIIFEEKYISCSILMIDQISLSGYLYFVRYWAVCLLQLFFLFVCFSIISIAGCDVMNSEVKPIFLIMLFFLHEQKVVTKTEIFWERKELLRWNKKHFSSF